MEIRMPLTLVTQANLTDCGLACTAIVARQKLETVLRVAIKECGSPKDGPHTTTDENLFKLLDHFGIKHGKKQKVKTVAELPDVAIMETRKMAASSGALPLYLQRAAVALCDPDRLALSAAQAVASPVAIGSDRVLSNGDAPDHGGPISTVATVQATPAGIAIPSGLQGLASWLG